MSLLPPRLQTGDLIGLIAPASPPPDPKSVDQYVKDLTALGFKVRVGKNVRKRFGYLAGTDKDRATDLMTMFADPEIKGIVCLRGGYGTPRLLPLLDYNVIRKNPKVFVGYSDITALHCAFLKKSGLLTFHGPVAASNLCDPKTPEFTRASWLKSLMDSSAPGSICTGYKGPKPTALRRGKVSGELIGGNLSLLTMLIGSSYLPNFRGKILFFEDVDEKPYRMDRMLTQLSLCGLLNEVAGIAIGLCDKCTDPKAVKGGEYRQSLEDVWKDRFASLKIPIVINLPFGHVPNNATLPVGGWATLDGNRADLILTAAAVK